MAHANSTTHYLCDQAACNGVMLPITTIGGEAAYECSACGHCAQAAIAHEDFSTIAERFVELEQMARAYLARFGGQEAA